MSPVILFLPGPLLSHVHTLHAVSAFSAIVGLFYRPRTRLFKTVGWASLFLFSFYLVNAYVLYLHAE